MMIRGTGSSCTRGASISIWPGQRWCSRLVVDLDVAQVRSDPPVPQSTRRRLNSVSSELCADGPGRPNYLKSESTGPLRADQSARAAAMQAQRRFVAGSAPGAPDNEGRRHVHLGIDIDQAPSRTGTLNPQRAAVSAFSAGHEHLARTPRRCGAASQ
jgi:hypothetical protein